MRENKFYLTGFFRKFLISMTNNFLPQRIEEGTKALVLLDMNLISVEDLVEEVKNKI